MSYGLYDCDINFTKVHLPNLEIMKYASYLKKGRQIASLSEEFIPEKYSTFIYRKDFNYETPHGLSKYPNLIYGGRGFHGQIYVPLEEEIEAVIPDISVYNKVLDQYLATHKLKKLTKTKVSTITRGEHFRLSLNGKTVWKDFEKQLRKEDVKRVLFIHDYNLNEIEGASEAMRDLGSFYLSGFGNKFPIEMYEPEDLKKWTGIVSSANLLQAQYNGYISEEHNELLFNYVANQSRRVYFHYNFLYGETYESFLDKIISFYNQIVKLRMTPRKSLLIFNEDFFLDRRWYEVVLLISRYYTRSINEKIKKEDIRYETMIDFVNQLGLKRQKSIPINRDQGKEILKFVEVENPDLYKEFCERHG